MGTGPKLSVPGTLCDSVRKMEGRGDDKVGLYCNCVQCVKMWLFSLYKLRIHKPRVPVLSWDGILGHQFNKSIWWIHVLLWFLKSLQKNPRNKKIWVYSWTATCSTWKMRAENQTKSRVWEGLSLCPETSTKNALQESHFRFSSSIIFTSLPVFFNF